MAKETLKDYVSRVMKEKGLTPPEIERRTDKRISDTTVQKIMKGTHKGLTDSTIKALAEGLDVPIRELLDIVFDLEPLPDYKDTIAHRFRQLEADYRAVPKNKIALAEPAIEIAENAMKTLKKQGGSNRPSNARPRENSGPVETKGARSEKKHKLA